MFIKQKFYVLVASLLFVIGCSGGFKSPLTPQSSSDTLPSDAQTILGVSDYFPDGSPAGGDGLLGIFEANVDLKNLTGEMTPMRKSTLTDVLEVVDITGFMTNFPCKDCVKIESVGIDSSNNVVLKIGIRHPFPVGNPSQPITGKNRADLHVFNIEGIVISNGSGSTLNFNGMNQKVGPVILVNPDGFTPYLDPYFDTILSTTATIHPYILHFDDYSTGNFSASNPMGFASVTTPPPSGNLVMPMGSGYDVNDYLFSMPGGSSLNFYFAVGCTYGISTNTFEDRFTPVFRVPQYNKKAASEVAVDVAYNNLATGITSSKATLNVKVLDINHGVSVGTNLDQMLADSSVKAISVEVPGVTAAPFVANNPVPTGGSGRNPLNPLTFQVDFTNSANAPQGDYTGLVKVLDSYLPGQNTHPFIGTNDGARRVGPKDNPLSGLFQIPEFATYQIFNISVAALPVDPSVTVHANPDNGYAPLEVNFSVDVILAPGSAIQSYSWTFGDTGISSEQNPIHTYNNTGQYTAKCVVTDSFNHTGDDTMLISVTTPAAPVVAVYANPTNGTAPLDVNFSVDVALAQGAIVSSYSWTFGDTGISSQQNPAHTYNDAGQYTAKCIVTDSFTHTGEDTILIDVSPPPPSFVGSNTCKTCHNSTYTTWEKHGHHFILNKTQGTAPVFPYSSIPNPPAGIAWNGGISYVIGGYGRKANFLDATGKVILGPDVQWNLASAGFVQYGSTTRSTKDYDCGKCHSTGWLSFAQNGGLHQDNLPGIMGTWAEAGVACEACHGKGSLHAANPSTLNITKDTSSALCGQCHSRQPTTKVFAEDNLIKDEQQYNEFLATAHGQGGVTCGTCHNAHASSMRDSQAPGTGVIKTCTDCHDAATHKVSGAMSGLNCTDCHMPLATKSAESSGSGTHIAGDLHSHIWAIDTTGVTLANYFSTDGTDTWVIPDGTGKVKLNLAYVCMQCHNGSREFAITSYATCAATAGGIHN